MNERFSIGKVEQNQEKRESHSKCFSKFPLVTPKILCLEANKKHKVFVCTQFPLARYFTLLGKTRKTPEELKVTDISFKIDGIYYIKVN